MRFDADGRLIRTDMWREGEYLDLWSVPHFLSGIMVGCALTAFHFGLRDASVIAFLLLVIYEMWEVMVQIEETRWNRVLDVVVGMTSCVPTVYLAPMLRPQEFWMIFATVVVVDGILSFFGWRASQKAAVLEAKLRERIMAERAQFATRMAEEKEKWRVRRERRLERRAAEMRR